MEKKNNEDELKIAMDQPLGSKIFLLILFSAIILSLSATYWRIVIKRDYNINASIDCDPYEEKCFVHVCNPDPLADGECTGDPEEDIGYTKNINRKAYNIPDCNPEDDGCDALSCAEGEEGCSYELCDENNVPEGDTCNDPEQYAKDNPIEEETACEEGDEECDEANEMACKEDDESCVAAEEETEECTEGDAGCAGKEADAGKKEDVASEMVE